MQKLLLAINHKASEEEILRKLKDTFMCVGTATYREAILPYLKDNQVDVLVIRDTLEGSVPILKMIENIRIDSPKTRIVFISREREKTDPLLSTLVSYGIYDIINKHSVPIDEIVSYIRDPRTFRDVSIYYDGIKRIPSDHVEKPAEEKPKSKTGFLSALFGTKPKTEQQQPTTQFETSSNTMGYDFDAIRAAMEENAKRVAQKDMDQLVQVAVETATKEDKVLISQQQEEIATLKESLKEINEQAQHDRYLANEAKTKQDQLQAALEDQKTRLQEIQLEHSREIASLTNTQSPQLMISQLTEKDKQLATVTETLTKTKEQLQLTQEQLDKVTAKLQAQKNAAATPNEKVLVMQNKLSMAQQKIAELEAALSQKATDDSTALVSQITDGVQISINEEFLEPTGTIHNIVFLGAKHGVGNTTVALNTAVQIANKGYKVLLMEFNKRFPMLNHFFEFIGITNGIDTACDGILSGNTQAVDKAIIQPHLLVKQCKKQLARAYKKLPAGLHMMLYSNAALTEKIRIDHRAIKDLFFYLTMQAKYSYIIVDLQPDDEEMKDLFLQSGFLTDKLVITANQDTHSIVAAGQMMEHLAVGRAANLVKNVHVILNRYQNAASIKKSDVQKWLKLGGKSIFCLSDDPVVYLDAGSYGIPYTCSKAKFAGEYLPIASTIIN